MIIVSHNNCNVVKKFIKRRNIMNELIYPILFHDNKSLKGYAVFKGAEKNNTITTDLDLVRLTKSGNCKAFDMLVIKYQGRVKSVVSRYLKLPQQIEDVVQETFIKAYSAIKSFREDSKFTTWLHRIGINTALSYLAAEHRRIPHYQPTSNADTHEPIVSEIVDEGSPEQALENDQITRAVSSALEKLPRDLREAITLREINELNYEEIANIMDCPIGTVRSRIFRARESIAARLRPQLDPNPFAGILKIGKM